ncbi:MAG: Glycosyl transferase family protein [Candidatus Daviesbacteria bacterium GW2011_GWB1_36_5]|uniref:Glycosyl transferase family protein n=1 Tax=Candidatus Daviesbacteria bacterium GW2011_GWB1_36_5 TaxID=1618426 RepID=A0A0G0EVM6_9BACT|nr:MAG: Glycosyl transferase family protein [Candidatus Daviesbacteria bacterium GW2011_GWB1_36_5]
MNGGLCILKEGQLMQFDVEVLFLAKKFGFEIEEVPVEWKYVDTERVQVIKDAAAALYDMLRIRLNDLQGKYVV